MTPRARKIFWGIVRLAVAAAVLAFLAARGQVDWGALRGLRDHWPLTLLAFALLIIVVVLISQRLCLLFRPRGLQLSLSDSLGLSMVANLFALVLPGGGGDIARLYYTARDAAGRRTEIGTLLLLDRVLALLALTIFPLLAAPLSLDLIRGSAILRTFLVVAALASIAIVVAIALSTSRRARSLAFVQWLFRKFPVRGYPALMLDTMHSFRHRVAVLATSVGLSLLAHSLSMLIVWLLAYAMGNGGSAQTGIPFLASIGFVANNLPLTPGGLGVGEAAFESLVRNA